MATATSPSLPTASSEPSRYFNTTIQIFLTVGVSFITCFGCLLCYFYKADISALVREGRQRAARYWGVVTTLLSRWCSAVSKWLGMPLRQYVVPACSWVLNNYDKLVEVVIVIGSIVGIKLYGWGGHTPHVSALTASGGIVSLFIWVRGDSDLNGVRILDAILFCLYTDAAGLVLSSVDYHKEVNNSTKLGLGLAILGFLCSLMSLMWMVLGKHLWDYLVFRVVGFCIS